MKCIAAVLCVLVLLTGCTGGHSEMDRAMELRSRLLGKQVAFEAEITADYGDKIYNFSMDCEADLQGDMHFKVLQPDTISGVEGTVCADSGKLTFDGKGLSFPLLADGQITPVSAPWVLLRTLRSGYLTSCGMDGNAVRIAIDDSYADDALHLDIWLDENDLPARGEIYWQGRRLLSVNVKNFRFV